MKRPATPFTIHPFKLPGSDTPKEAEPKLCHCGEKALFKVGRRGFCYEHRNDAQKFAKLQGPVNIGAIPD